MEKKFVIILGGAVLVALVVVGGLYLRQSPDQAVMPYETKKSEEQPVVVSPETKLPTEDISPHEDRVAKVIEIVQVIDTEIEDDGAAFEEEQRREMESLKDGGELMTELGTSYDESNY